jgi:hypothetical protein
VQDRKSWEMIIISRYFGDAFNDVMKTLWICFFCLLFCIISFLFSFISLPFFLFLYIYTDFL